MNAPYLLNGDERETAVSELIRVAKSGAPIFVSVIGKLSAIVGTLKLFQNQIGLPVFEKIRDYGGEYVFTAFHSFLPEELRNLFERSGNVKVVETFGLYGIGSNHMDEVNKLAKNRKRWEVWLETHYRTCTHPSVVGLSEHMMIVCKKE